MPSTIIPSYIWKRGKTATLKHKPDLRNGFCSFLLFLLLISISFSVGSVRSTDGSVYTTYYASDYSILNGTYVSGSVPPSVTSIDADYLTARSIGTDTSVNMYNPSGYTLLGSTSWVSGSISNLTSNDGAHVVFSSYSSGLDIEDYVDNDTSDVDGSANKGTHSNFTAQQYGPDLINDTLTEENTAGSTSIWLYVNADDGTRTDWTRVGTNPYLDVIDYNSSYVYVSGNNKLVGDFSFADSGKSTETVDNVEVQLFAKHSGNNNLEVFVWDGFSWTSLGTQTTSSSWGWMNWTATTILDTWTKIDGAKIHIQSSVAAGTYEVDCARLKVDYTDAENYELDLEVQWTSVDYDELNEELCIYGGSMGGENIRVDVWNGSGWENLFNDLNSGWSNISVSPYLDLSTFIIRFKGDTETGDTMQDTWNIDAILLHVWTEQYTVEAEVSGSSNTYNWKQLNWTFDSAWTIASVSVSIQLYSYTLGDYPTSGNGFVAYTSSATANTDETKTLTITTNPQHFRDVTGNWKMKVEGVKNTTTQFDLKADWVKLEPTHWSEYTVSTEFFLSNMTTKTPTQLNFTIASQYNTASVSVSIQIWNYSSSAYAKSGQAYLDYTSSGTNETRLLSINANPQSYTSNGNATIKITGVLSNTTQYQQEINQLKLIYSYENSPPVLDPIGDKIVDELSLLNFTVTASDPDVPPQTLTFSLGPGAPPGASVTAGGVFTWTPTEDQGPGNYTIRVIVSDGSLTDYENVWVDVIEVSARPSFWPFGPATVLLYISPVFFGLLFIFGLRLKRKKKTKPRVGKNADAFSQQFGMTHEQIKGKKMLFEIDPKSDNQEDVLSFVSEAKNNKELLFILTNKNSALHSAFSGDPDVKFLLLTSETSSPLQVNERETLLPASDLSVLLDSFGSIQKIEMEKTVNVLFDNLSDVILRCGFKKTYKFMRLLLEAISSSKVTVLILFNPTVHGKKISSSIRGMLQREIA